MERIYVILTFIIAFVVYQHILWYVPHDYQYKLLNEEIKIFEDQNISSHLFNHNGPLVLDARQMFEYNWNNFEIPMAWIQEHIVCGKIHMSNEERSYETNVSYMQNHNNDNYFSMFHQNKNKELYASVYRYFKLPKHITSFFSKYENDIVVTQGNHHKSPWFYNHQTYHIYYIAKGEVTFRFLSRNAQTKTSIENDSMFHYINDDYLFETKNVDEKKIESSIQSIKCSENSMIIIPYHWIYMFETHESSILLNYYYKSILNNVSNKYLELYNFLHQCFK